MRPGHRERYAFARDPAQHIISSNNNYYYNNTNKQTCTQNRRNINNHTLTKKKHALSGIASTYPYNYPPTRLQSVYGVLLAAKTR